ncbi:MAG: DUF6398 domain-containing protein [Nitrososphaerota archaeon]|jgi:hypothetical protein|nr:DUF6398 domain-containing protein [Nitrososphaerota archaeon]
MYLSRSEVELFYKLWCTLTWTINQKHKIVPAFKKPVYGEHINTEPIIAIREKLWENPQWIDEFLDEKGSNELNENEREILRDWRKKFIKDKFIVVKHLATYSVFMTFDDPAKLYGVYGISNPIRETAPNDVPFIVETILLPFEDKIIYDSLLVTYKISFGKNAREDINDSYKQIKEKTGIIETIGIPPTPIKPQTVTKKPKSTPPNTPAIDTKGANVPKAMATRYVEIAELIEKTCDEKLNAEYKEICLNALVKLCRKRPSPLITGRAQTWACGIIYAIGSNNFIFDKSQPMNVTASEIAEWFNLSKSTAGNKAAEVNKLLGLSYFNTEFQLKTIADRNPTIWYLKVNGLVVDIRTMPREIQEEALHKGLIPYISTDKRNEP